MLSAGSPAVAPVNAVEVGDDCSLVCDDDRDGTLSKDRFFLGCSGAPNVAEELCPSLCEADAVRMPSPPSSDDPTTFTGVFAKGIEDPPPAALSDPEDGVMTATY